MIEIGLNEWGDFPFKENLFVLEVISRALENSPIKS